MASLDLTASPCLPFVANVTLSGTANELRIVQLPTGIDIEVSIRPVATDAYLLDSSVVAAHDEGGDVSGEPHATLDHDAWTELLISRHGNTTAIGLGSATTSQAVQILINRRSVQP